MPVKTNILKGKAQQNPVNAASESANVLREPVRKVSPTQKEIKTTARAVYNRVAPAFQEKYNISLANALSKVPELNLQIMTKNQQRDKRRQHYRATKENVEKQMEETAFKR